MNHNPTPRWSPMVSGPEDEFASFLDFGDLTFSTFGDAAGPGAGGAGPEGGLQSHEDGRATAGAGDGGAMDTTMEGTPTATILGANGLEEPGHMGMTGFPGGMPDVDMSAEFMNRQHHQQQQQQHSRHAQQQQQHHAHLQQQRYFGHNPVPPTPNSLEMHGGHGDFYQNHAERQQQLMYEHYRRHHQNDQMNFTPLVSPAVTPLDTQFQNPDYNASVDCFSPLTSPALRAQTHNVQQAMYGSMRSSDTSDTTSPIDMNIDYPPPTSASTPGSLRKSKRTGSSSSSKDPTRLVRQSPVVKAQSRRKHPSSTVIPPKEVAGILEEAHRARRANSGISDIRLPLPHATDSSGPDSVSPEPLSEILMPPPATPKSNSSSRSPNLVGKQKENQSQQPPNEQVAGTKKGGKGAPATPASLMKIRKGSGKNANGLRSSSLKEQAMSAEADMEQILEEITLPDATDAPEKVAMQPLKTTDANSAKTSSASLAFKGVASAPVTTTASTFPSPTASGVASPNGQPNGKRGEPAKSKLKESKKRGSMSNQISPALRPKISPSIKPLLPEGAIVSPETSALLLASKSNYQNILEGTHLPGVNYPETLSTNLTSKRTSHKIAEQGRRNRINSALQEIASLLPPQTPTANGQATVNGAPNGAGVQGPGQAALMMTTGTAAQQSNSKASTVELAIDYIRTLQDELKTVKDELRVEKERNANGVAKVASTSPGSAAEVGSGSGES